MRDGPKAVLDWIDARAPRSGPDATDGDWLADFRGQTALLRGLSGDPAPLHAVSHGLAGTLPVRLYRPAAGRLPVLLHLHGGGAIAGSVDGHDPALRALAKRTGWLVAAPDYRLAPGHPFPAQLEDAEAALDHLIEQADALGIDPDRIMVSGDSIGGTLATALAGRRRGGSALKGQILLYPNTDLRMEGDYPSRVAEDGHVIALADLDRQIRLYLGADGRRDDPQASPILLGDLTDMPPTLIVTCGADPLRDEGEAYARRLEAAGIAVTHHRFDGMIHGFLQMGGHIDETGALLDLLADWLAALS